MKTNKSPMSPEQRKQLEEMAAEHSHIPGYESPIQPGEGGGDCCDEDALASFMAGAEAAWEMATSAERERSAKILEPHEKSDGIFTRLKSFILNPPKDG